MNEEYFAPIKEDGSILHGVWHLRDAVAVRVGVPNAEMSPNAHLQIPDGVSLLEAFQGHVWPDGSQVSCVKTMTLKPGQYYPRMARPHDQHPNDGPGYCPGSSLLTSEIASMRGQLTALIRNLTQICQIIHPNKDTFSAYGHEIRNLLILSCTEVESHWRGILVANNVKKDRFTTVQYVKLLSAMQLHKYRIALPHYPWLEPLVPFAEWTPKAPTKSLAWYNAYNHVKHDREGKFADAQLIHAINAVAACAILLCAQVGTPLALRPRGEIGEFIQLLDAPTWAPNEVYTDRYEGWAANNDPVPYPFA